MGEFLDSHEAGVTLPPRAARTDSACSFQGRHRLPHRPEPARAALPSPSRPPASSVSPSLPWRSPSWRGRRAAQSGRKPPAQPEGLGVSIEGRSKPTLCAEDDNVYLTFTNPRVRYFRIEARPPAVIGSIVVDSTAPDFTDCTIQDQPVGPEDKQDRVVLHEDDSMMLVGYRHSEFWRKGDVPLTVGNSEERALHLVQLFVKTPQGPLRIPRALSAGRLLARCGPSRPRASTEVAYGTSFLVGPVEEKEAPVRGAEVGALRPRHQELRADLRQGRDAARCGSPSSPRRPPPSR